MRQEKFKMERQGLINVGDEIEISESGENSCGYLNKDLHQ